jgi:predicted nucleic acid-binding protein
VKIWLLDTGPIVARLDEDDAAHAAVTAALDSFRGQFITTSAVITEAMYFAANIFEGPASLTQFLELSGTQILDCCQLGELKSAVSVMEKYADAPMDFADATLVHLAGVLRQYSICTLDRRGFSIFRTAAGRHFQLVLDQPG